MSMIDLKLLIGLLLLSFSQVLTAQYSFLVVNDQNEALIGVEMIHNNKLIDISDVDGKIIIDNEEIPNSLVFRYLGFEDHKLNTAALIKDQTVIRMIATDQRIDEVVIVGRTNQKRSELPFHVERISQAAIRAMQAQTAAELLEKTGAVYIQKSQMGGGSPVLRGFEANKILLVIDGVRMNNAIYRSGHLQNAITVDHGSLESVEVIFGPGSLSYGSDAIGGVIHYRTKTPKLNFQSNKKSNLTGHVMGRYSSANEEKRTHIDFNYGSDKWASYTSIGFADFGDLRMGSKRTNDYPDFGKQIDFVETINNIDLVIPAGDRENIQIGTAYHQYDLVQKFKYQSSERVSLGLNLQYSNSSNIPRYDQLIEREANLPRFAEWYYGPQTRMLISPILNVKSESALFNEIMLIGSFQKIDEDRNSRLLNADFLEQQNEDLKVYGLTADFKKSLKETHTISYGFELQNNDVASSAFNQFRDGSSTIALTRYPSGGANLTSWGAYLQNNITINKLQWHAGLRFSGQTSKFDYSRDDAFEWPEYYFDGFENNNTALTWMTALSYKMTDNINIRLTSGSAFRSPNIDDLAKVRIKSDEITVPNPNLKSEKTQNIEFAVNYDGSKFKWFNSVYYTRLKDAIVRKNASLPDGDPNYELNGNTYNVTSNFNDEFANVYGVSSNIIWSLNSRLDISKQISYTRGESFDADNNASPLAHIPPLFGKIGLSYKAGIASYRLNIRYNAKKSIEDFGGSTDNPELATQEGSLAWSTINTYLNLKLKNQVDFSVGIENMLDTHYRPFASGLSGAGRNFICSINYNFGN